MQGVLSSQALLRKLERGEGMGESIVLPSNIQGMRMRIRV